MPILNRRLCFATSGPSTPPQQLTRPGRLPYGWMANSPTISKRGTNGLAIASLVLGILWLYGIGSILALVFGYVALNQIKRRNENGRGLAIAGTLLGWIGVGGVLLIIIGAIASH